MADALVSGASVRKDVEVQLLSAAPAMPSDPVVEGDDADVRVHTGRVPPLAVGFRIHAHGFRHTFATVATQLGWNFERLRSAMGHEEYMTLHRYVRLAMDRDLGRLEDWAVFIAVPPHVGLPPGQLMRR